jgi:ribosomal protein L4
MGTEEVETQPGVVPMDKLAKVYIKIRDKISELTRDYETQVEALKLQQQQVTDVMKTQMRAVGELSSKTAHGTVSLLTKVRYQAMDADAFKTFVIENEAVDLYEQRIAQKNMAAFIADNPEVVVPGLNVISEVVISVRRPTK